MPPLNTPAIALPFEILSNGQVAEVEQDSLDEIAMSVEAILRYPIGYRDELPNFGSPDPTFRLNSEDVAAMLAEHVSRWEPRARIFFEERESDWEQMIRNFIVRIEGAPDHD